MMFAAEVESVADAVIMTVAHPSRRLSPGPGPSAGFGPVVLGLLRRGPIAGAVIAVGAAFVLRGCGRRVRSGTAAAQGDLFTEGPPTLVLDHPTPSV